MQGFYFLSDFSDKTLIINIIARLLREYAPFIWYTYFMIVDLSKTPHKPGVYIFKGSKEQILYVGKAKDLKNRLRSYFYDSVNLDPRKFKMVQMIKDVSYIITDNELEALILEANLIKQYKPRFNIILRDDKNYPYIKITIKEQWPRIEVVRKIERDSNLYFGPYVPAQSMWEMLDFIRRNFLIRSCKYDLQKHIRPCIQYEMSRCSAPCAGLISKEEYLKIVDEVILFLKGEKRELLEKLYEKMNRLSEELRFEEAAKVRDKIFNLQRAFESQKVIALELGDIDIIGHYLNPEDLIQDKPFSIAFNVLFVRGGILIGAKDFFIERTISSDLSEAIHNFVEIFYSKEIIPPDVILVNVMPQDSESLLAWLIEKKGADLTFEVPKKGKKLELLKMSNENARVFFLSKKKALPYEEVLSSVKEKLHLRKLPLSIGAFDISTIHGAESVGAFVYWQNGEFKKDFYRHLKIKSVTGIDDYSMMKEAVKRIMLNILENKAGLKMPDLLIIDGAKGHLEVATEALKEFGLDVDIVAVAKKPDRAFLIRGDIISLDDRSEASNLIRRIRDEAHRFAITFHRRLRDKRFTESALEKIKGIGRKRRLELLRHFGSIENIRNASIEEIARLKGFNKKIAQSILEGIKK
jgi:excinuclease ABC subunit C